MEIIAKILSKNKTIKKKVVLIFIFYLSIQFVNFFYARIKEKI